MKKNFFMHVLNVFVMVLLCATGTGYAMAADFVDQGTNTPASPDGETVVGLADGGGHVVEGARSLTGDQKIMDEEWFVKQVNKAIVEMKFVGTPIDQILRAGTVNKSDSIVVKYYSVGQRPLKVGVTSFTSNSNGSPAAITLEDDNIVGEMDTLLVLDGNGEFVMGGSDADPSDKPLMIRVHAINDSNNKPMVYAVNGKNTSNGNPYIIDTNKIQAGYQLLRMGRAAAEKDVTTGAYYQLPEPTEQYCQRFIMEVEESVYTRFSKTELDWTFSRMEKMAMEDMRIGMEATGLFGIKSKHTVNRQGVIYTTGGIWYMAGKNAVLGHYEVVKDPVTGEGKTYSVEVDNPDYDSDQATSSSNPLKITKTYYVQEYVITEDELVDFVADIIKNAGNASRKKMVFVDDDMYTALCKIRTNNRIRLLEQKDNYMNLGLDFETYKSMGTTLMFYRHDLFKAWGFEKKAFVLDPEYLDKWVFGTWSREEYDLKKLFVRNSNAVTMEEFSCWTLAFPNAHARVSAPEYTAIEKVAA